MNFVLKRLNPNPLEVLERWLPTFIASTEQFEQDRLYVLFGLLADYLSDLNPNDKSWRNVFSAIDELGAANDREIDNLLVVGLFETLPEGSVALNCLRLGLSGRAKRLLVESTKT